MNGTPLSTRARIQAMHVNPNYVVHKIAKNACEYCRHIKILRPQHVQQIFLENYESRDTACAADFFYKMTNRANKIDKKCVNFEFFFFCRIQSFVFFSKKTRTPLGIKWDVP